MTATVHDLPVKPADSDTPSPGHWAALVEYVKAHHGMLDDLAACDLSLAAFLVAQSRSMDTTWEASR